MTTYREKYRPQFHFTARANWLNDPNGCVFHDGKYHLFFQHNPSGVTHGNMTWGHAVSSDLVHWEQLPHALLPYDDGTIYSGSAVSDSANVSGLGQGSRGPLVAAFTHARKPFGQAIAFSNDQGLNWEYYDGGRYVVPNQGLDEGERDPKVFRHDPSGRWIMVLWVRKSQARFFTSRDLLQWTHVSDFVGEGFFECPDFFALALDGDETNVKWVLHDAAFNYWIGSFDGKTFEAESGPVLGDLGGNFYAAQTWNDLKGRVIQIAWMRGGKYPGMPFNQQMTFPCELSLRTTPGGIRLFRSPADEIAALYAESTTVSDRTLSAGDTLDVGGAGDLFDVQLEATASPDLSFCVRVAGQDIVYSNHGVTCLGKTADIPPSGDVVSLRILVDRTSIEVFANGGEISMSSCFLPPDELGSVQLCARNGPLQIRTLTVHRLSSAWEQASN